MHTHPLGRRACRLSLPMRDTGVVPLGVAATSLHQPSLGYYNTGRPRHQHLAHRCLAILWKLWDSRNACVFRNEQHTPLDTLRNIILDFTLWAFRFKDPVSREAAVSWRLYLSSHCNP